MKMDYESAWNELKNDLIDLAEAETATASCEAYRRVYMKMGKIEQEHHRNSDGNGKGNVSGDVKEDVSRIVREALKDSGVVNNLEELEKKICEKPTGETGKPRVIFVDGGLGIPDDLRREALRRGIRIVGVSAEAHRFPIPPFLFGELPF